MNPAVFAFINQLMAKDYLIDKTEHHIKYYDRNFDLWVDNRRNTKVLIVDKRNDKPVMYNDINVATQTLLHT